MTSIVDKILHLDQQLVAAGLPHAFGGALALAWCTRRARGTIDIDVNVFVDVDRVDDVIVALAGHIVTTEPQHDELVTTGQVRLWWDTTPVDVFLNTTDFHREASTRTRVESFAGHDVPFLSCRDLAVFKAFFNRAKDWVDLDEMHANGSLDIAAVVAVLIEYLGADDERITRLHQLSA